MKAEHNKTDHILYGVMESGGVIWIGVCVLWHGMWNVCVMWNEVECGLWDGMWNEVGCGL